MFNNLKNVFNDAVKKVKTLLSGSSAKKTSPARVVAPVQPKSVPKRIDSVPKLSFAPIARYGESSASINSRTAAWKASPEYAAQDAWSKRIAAEAKKRKEDAARKQAEAVFNKVRSEYELKAKKVVDAYKKSAQSGFLSRLTGGFAGENSARKFADKQLAYLEKTQVKSYEKRLNDFLKEQAKRKADIENKKFSSRQEFDRAVSLFSKWEGDNISDLEYARAASAGLMSGYGTKAQEPGRTVLATAGQWLSKNIVTPVTNNPIFKYTLGEGDKNVPSIITAPGRLVNWLGNAANSDRKIAMRDGSVVNASKQAGNAWTKTFNQRNFNMGFTKAPEKDTFVKKIYEEGYKNAGGKDSFDKWYTGDRKKTVDQLFSSSKTQVERWNTAQDFLFDPAVALGSVGRGIAKGFGFLGAAAKTTRAGRGFFDLTDKIATSKSVKWLTKEYKNTNEQLYDAIDSAKTDLKNLQDTLLPRVAAINKKLAGGQKVDVSVFDDFANLSDAEAKVLQRMVDGRITGRDRLILAGSRNLATRTKLEQIALKWTDFTEKMKLVDSVTNTRFGAGKKFYSPYTAWTRNVDGGLDNYNFFKRRGSKIQSAEDMRQGAIDRYFKSSLDELGEGGQNAVTKQRLLSERSEILNRYDTAKAANVSSVERLRKANSGFFGTTRKVVGAPMRLWKASVLKYRPAWAVNNAIYNTQAAVLAAGPRALIEQAKMLRPSNFRKALREVPDSVKTNLVKEIGRDRVSKFHSNIENWSRVAAFRAGKSKGWTDAKALSRTNKYLFDYSIRNIERPLRAVMPFYSWSKNITRASVQMPFDRPLAAKTYNAVDRHQNEQFEREFEKIVPELLSLGYTEAEIEKIKTQQSKYFKGRLKVGDKWITTPFNAFSDRGLSSVGVNPFLTSLSESSASVDNFGNKIRGSESTYIKRLASKFPQYNLAEKGYKSARVNSGADKPSRAWIGAAGSEGYGLGKEQQGYDPSKKNYVRKLDPRANLKQDLLAFAGIPRGLEFNQKQLINSKRLEKATEAYFSLNAKDLPFDQAEASRQAIFKKFGITADEFYGGVLSKYDTANTTRIKGLKEGAAAANKSLFAEYAAQPAGTRNMWATKKLSELTSKGYFNDNPFLKSFNWVNPDTVARAKKQEIVTAAIKSGDWTNYRRVYGKTQKQLAYEKAKASGDWVPYVTRYGTSTKVTPHQYAGKYFRSAESMARYKEGEFWGKYAAASKTDRRLLLKNNPQYNKRADWTDEQWDQYWSKRRKNERERLMQWGGFAAAKTKYQKTNKLKSDQYLTRLLAGRSARTKVVFRP